MGEVEAAAAHLRPVVAADPPPIVSPRVTRASLPPVTLDSGRLECPACGGSFVDWEGYYGHVIAPDNKVCAWVQIDLIDVVPNKKKPAAPALAA
mmetsp:Transcript_7618/g.23974  ORF Transcript_7618/g.23974 Transcript_7618/m.23974 type:complete len:94 (-) Transcript_7618:74-355(-)